MITMNIVRISVFFYLIYVTEGARNISCFVNPGLDVTTKEESHMNVVHIVSEGEEDAIHFVWSTYKLPSVIVSRTTKNTSLLINSTKLVSFEKDAILFKNGMPLESIGVTFSKIWELHYNNDSSELKDVVSAEDLNMESFYWTDVNETLRCSDSFASVTLRSNSSHDVFSKGGTVQIQFSLSGDQELSDEFPHLVFTGNSTLQKFVLENLYSEKTKNSSCSRYGFEISLFALSSEECKSYNWRKVVTKTINDEFSPGVFSDVKLLSPCSEEMHESSYLSWRPIAYTGVKPIVANSTDVTMMENPQSYVESGVHSIAELYFLDKSNVSIFNITFGTLGDGCYVTTEYTSWSLMIGIGSVVEISLSSVVIILTSVGVGLLILFLLSGSAFILYHKCKEKDDDLLLN